MSECASHLRRSPVEVQGRGPAVRCVELSAAQAVERYARAAMRSRDVYGFTPPGYRGQPADVAPLTVPVRTSALAVPRSINGVGVRMFRVGEAVAL